MNEKTLAALRGSIAKWEAIVRHEGTDDGMSNCPLCNVFHFALGGRGNPVKCGGCPVRDATGQMGCGGSPYDDYEAIAIGECSEKYGSLEDAAQAELDFLRGLLPAERADEMSTTTRRAIFVPLAWMARVVTWAFLGRPAWVFLVPGCWLMQLSDWLHSQQSKPTNREAQP